MMDILVAPVSDWALNAMQSIELSGKTIQEGKA